MQLKNYPGAINAYNKVLSIDNLQVDVLSNRALAFINEQKYDLAKKDITRALEDDPNNGQLLYNLALCQTKTNQKDQALITYNQLIMLDYKTPVAAKQKGKILVEQEEYSKASAAFDKAIRYAEDDFELFYLRGYCKLKMDDLASANLDFDRSIKLNNEYKPSILNKAYTSYKLEKYDEAVEDFTRVLDINPNDKDTRVNRGLSALQLKDYERAYADFSNVIEIDETNAIAYYNRANAAIGLSQMDQACADMREAAKLGYNNAFDHIRQVCGDN